MKRALASLLAISLVSAGLPVLAYDTSFRNPLRRAGGSTTVALIPFSEGPSPELAGLLERLAKDIRKRRGVRLMDAEKTMSIIGYYNSYIKQASPDDPARRPLSGARQAILSGDYTAAAKLLAEAEAGIEQQILQGKSNAGLYEISLIRAKIHHADKDEGAVVKEYDKIVRQNPYFELDPNLYGKWERDALKTALRYIDGERTGSIKVTSSPEGSELILNGFHMGITPMTLEGLPPGRHCVEIKTVNHVPEIRYLDLRANEKLTLDADLPEADQAFTSGWETIRPSSYQTDQEISNLVSTLGYHLGVDKVVLVSTEKDAMRYRIGDAELGAVYNARSLPPDAAAAALAIHEEVRANLLKDPQRYVDQTVGSPHLHQTLRPVYKRPVFWFLVGIGVGGAAVGGVLAAILGGGSAAAATGGVVIGL